MKKSLLLPLFIIFCLTLQAQKDTVNIALNPAQKSIRAADASGKITIYPVPVRDNFFTIRCENEFSFVKVTNIIGQDIFKEKFNTPLTSIEIFLDNPTRGMYLVTILFSDGVRVVKKIMIEQTE
jgi:hypothetical protein